MSLFFSCDVHILYPKQLKLSDNYENVVFVLEAEYEGANNWKVNTPEGPHAFIVAAEIGITYIDNKSPQHHLSLLLPCMFHKPDRDSSNSHHYKAWVQDLMCDPKKYPRIKSVSEVQVTGSLLDRILRKEPHTPMAIVLQWNPPFTFSISVDPTRNEDGWATIPGKYPWLNFESFGIGFFAATVKVGYSAEYAREIKAPSTFHFDFGSLISWVPSEFYSMIVHGLPIEYTSFQAFDCDSVTKSELPDIRFNIDGLKEESKLTSEEYIQRIPNEKGEEEKCILALIKDPTETWTIGAPILKRHPMRLRHKGMTTYLEIKKRIATRS
ncbi:unnamed protein product [Albugo candida]|uniref:Uncharacterized protein n=1 Tax=Albugo candida TaxID=65357 RepID=A0A024G5L1_9STRA|nr:unnamed protein product [Albugo candida]|eukprot:CCI41605.1 unnamed protein product [Albugo candida]